MRFTETALPGAFVIDVEPAVDDRGLFARTWCAREMADRGLADGLSQCGTSFNRSAGVLRGMHFQAAPHGEEKVVRCTRGAIHDVIVDLRSTSPTFRRWFAAELTAENRRAIYVPRGLAHGFQTLVADTEVLYLMSQPYHPESARGVRWDDPAFGIAWPETPHRTISQRDASYPDFAAGGARP